MRAASELSILLVILIWMFGAPEVLQGCSMIHIPPITHELEERAAVVGEVVGYVTDDSILPTSAPVPGIVMEVQEQLLGPEAETVHVFLLTVDPACEPLPAVSDAVSMRYPVGSSVALIGEVRSVSPGHLSLVSSSESFGHLARISDPLPRTGSGALDFGEVRSHYEENDYETFSPDVAWQNAERGWLEDFEYLRALQMLSAFPPDQRSSTARNLIDYRGWRRYRDIHALEDFERLLELYDVPQSDRSALLTIFRKRNM